MNATTLPEVTKKEPKYVPAEWQADDIETLKSADYSANWSEMGCYKTSTLLWLIDAKLIDLDRNPKVLIITTRTGKGTYFQLAPEILEDWTILNVNATNIQWEFAGKLWPWDKGIPVDPNRPLIVVAHYNCFTNKSKMRLLLTQNHLWDFVALDEAHRIKEKNTQWTRNIKRLNIGHRHVMTGTGFINKPSEIWSILNFLDKKRWPSHNHFKEFFCDFEDTGSGFTKEVGVKPERLEEFRALVRSLGPRRTKVEVFKDLKEPVYTKIDIDLNPVQRKMYDEIKYQLMTLDKNGYPIHSPNVLSLLNRMRQISVATPEVVRDYFDPVDQVRKIQVQLTEPSSKLDALIDIIEGLEWDDERHDQIVVFSNFKGPIELAKHRFDKKKISYIHMEEKDSDSKRYEKWAIQFPKKEHQVFISTLQLGSESISLTTAQTLVFLDRSWSPKDNEQGISRVWRPGQTQVPQVINIEARDTVDSRVLSINQRKMGWFRDIFGD